MKSAIERQVRRYFKEEVGPKLASRFASYIIDFALTPLSLSEKGGSREGESRSAERLEGADGDGDGDDFTMWVIELNPFMETTGERASWVHPVWVQCHSCVVGVQYGAGATADCWCCMCSTLALTRPDHVMFAHTQTAASSAGSRNGRF
jgi:hypothetical protein